MNSSTLEPNNVDTFDRLSFTLFLAVAVHALIILGITFNINLKGNPSPTLEITLATHKTARAPQQADYLAQFNQEASGSSDESRQMTTDQLAPIEAPQPQQVNPTPSIKANKPISQPNPQTITTQSESRFQAKLNPEQEEREPEERQGNDEVDTPLSSEIASLRAKLEEQRQVISKRPRIRRITSVATRSSVDAAYLQKWTSKVEFVGNRNFPAEAIDRKIYGKLRLATNVRANGTVASVELLQSSGFPVLDQAALKIVELASPFPLFPTELRKEVDQLEIIRTWHFELSGLSTSSQK